MTIFIVAEREIKLGFRNPFAYTFLLLFTLFSCVLLLIQSQAQVSGYTQATGTMLHLTLYLLPLMTLLLGSFSLTAEKEDGGWQLLSIYPLSASSFILGKFLGLAVVLLSIVAFGFGLSSLLGLLVGKSFQLSALMFLLSFAVCLVLLFLGIALVVGSLCQNRWQALTVGVGIWFFLILGWPALFISVLGLLPYSLIKPTLEVLILLNPAEFLRVYTVMKMGAGSIFGADYYQWVQWVQKPAGTIGFFLLCLTWLASTTAAAIFFWERGRYRD